MRALPIVERELRVAARQRATYISRLIAAAGALAVMSFVVISGSLMQTPQSSQGRQLFDTLSGFAFLLCLIAGLRRTADCVSAERREGTLGLLFLTDLRGHDVVLGKLAAGSIDSFLALGGLVPVMSVAWLLGGVTAMEFVRMTLMLTATLLWSLSAGILVSSVNQQERKALAGTLLIVFVQSLGPFAIGYYYLELTGSGFGQSIDWMFLTPSPWQGFRLVSDGLPGWSWKIYWTTLAFVAGSACAFLSIAMILLPRSGRLRPPSSRAETVSKGWRRWSQGKVAIRDAYRRRLLDRNPYAWMACRDRFKVTMVWLMLIGLTIIWTWSYSRHPATLLDRESLFLVMGLTHCLIKWWVISEVCTRSVEDHRSGGLELILCTPLSARRLMAGQGLAVLVQFGKPAAVIALVDFLFLHMGATQGYGLSVSPTEWIWIWAGCFLMLPIDLWAITWHAMKCGITEPTINRAIGGTVSRILVTPLTIASVCHLALSGTFFGRMLTHFYWTGVHSILAWQATGIAISVVTGFVARRQLPSLIGQIAVSRFEKTKH